MKTHNADLKLPLIDLEADNTATGGKQEQCSVQPERLSEGDNMYCIYWIHLPEYTFDKGDELTHGYIGLTCNYKERMKSHKKKKSKTHLTDAIKKYGWDNLNKVIMYENLSFRDALYIEHILRPGSNIGWNIQMGGVIGVEKEWYDIPKNRKRHKINTSLATKIGIAEKDTFEKRSERAKLSRLNNKESYKKVPVGSRNGRALLNEQQVKCIKFELIPEGFKDRVIADMYGVNPPTILQIRHGKTWKHIVCDSPDHE